MTIEFDSEALDLKRLLDRDKKTKPTDFDSDIASLVALYADGAEARRLVQSYLHTLGLGLRDNRHPIQVGHLRKIVDRTAGRYDAPATRRLKRGNRMLSDSSPEHVRMTNLYAAMTFDSVVAEADKMSALCGSVFLRFYPTDRGLRVRLFTPDLVHRLPDDALADEVDYDHALALKLAQGYEVHLIDQDGRRRMFRVDQEGGMLADQPFEDGLYPESYGETLPIVRLDSAPTVGRAWLQPRLSRVSLTMALSGILGDTQSLVATQAHNQALFKTPEPTREPPDKTGHGTVVKVHEDDEYTVIQQNPLIDAVGSVVDRLTAQLLMAENIPLFETTGDQPPTGSALKTAERGLRAIREAGRPLAVQAEKRIWEVVRTLAMAHELTDMPLSPETEMMVELAQTADQPEDSGTILEDGARSMALGLESAVQVGQRLWSCSRDEAIRRIEQAREDQEAYPPPSAASARQVAEGEGADVIATAAGNESGDSVTDSALGRTAADARAERREDAA